MILKVLAVAAYMFRAMIEFSLRRAFRPAGLEKAVTRDYKAWAGYIKRIFRLNLEVHGREHLPPEDGRRLVVVSNHQSQLDIPVLVAALDRHLGFVAKRELGRIPLLAFWIRQLGCVLVDRSNRTEAHRALEAAAKGMGLSPVVVFPEGTRSKDGALLPLKLGGFRLAILARARILPVHIEGTRDAGEGRRRGHRGPHPVRVRLFPAIDTEGMSDSKPALNRMKHYVEACWRAPAGEDAPVPAPLPDAAVS